MLIFHKATPTVPAHYLDKDTGQKWKRIAGGIGWPQEAQPGVGLILAEDSEEPANYSVLLSVRNHNAGTLLEQCKALELEYPLKVWYGNIDNRAMVVLLYEFNKGKYPEDKLRFQMAPLASEPNNSGYYLPKVIELGIMERLNAAKSLQVMTELKADSMWPKTHLNKNIAAFPTLAALCYPLAYMMMYSGKAIKPMKRDYMKQYGGAGWQL